MCFLSLLSRPSKVQGPLSFLNACCGSDVPRKPGYGWVQPWRVLIQSAAPLVIQF